MGKFFSRLFFFILATAIILTIFLSFFGIETDKFDGLIKGKANEVNRHITIGFQKTKIHLNLTKLNLVVKLQNPKILVKENEIILSRLDLFLSLRSFFTSDFLLKRAEVAFEKNDIKDLTKITNIFLPRIINKKLNKIFYKGKLEGKFIVPFESNGKIGAGYAFSGKISDATINLKKEFSITNLTSEVSHTGVSNNSEFKIKIKKGSIYNLELQNSIINLKRGKNEIKIKSLLMTKGKLNFSQIQKVSTIFDFNLRNFKNVNGTIDLKTDITFDLNDKFRIKNFSYLTKCNIAHLEIETQENKIIKKYLPEHEPKMIFKNNSIKLTNSDSKQSLELKGSIKVKDKFDNFEIKEIYNYSNKSF